MPLVTQIIEQRRRPNRRNVHLDGRFAFGCNVNVIARFRLREGLSLTTDQINEILRGEVRQDCLDAALRFVAIRLHSQAELRRKLLRHEYGEDLIDAVLADLKRLGYVDDEKFALAKASSAAQRKHHGRRRALQELAKAGVKSDVASRAADEVYSQTDSTQMARELALKHVGRLSRLDPAVARRRLAGMLQRRGFDYDAIRPVIDEVLGREMPHFD